MNISAAAYVRAESVRFTGSVLRVALDDGREISLPINDVP
jgi:hypothetical protein